MAACLRPLPPTLGWTETPPAALLAALRQQPVKQPPLSSPLAGAAAQPPLAGAVAQPPLSPLLAEAVAQPPLPPLAGAAEQPPLSPALAGAALPLQTALREAHALAGTNLQAAGGPQLPEGGRLQAVEGAARQRLHGRPAQHQQMRRTQSSLYAEYQRSARDRQPYLHIACPPAQS